MPLPRFYVVLWHTQFSWKLNAEEKIILTLVKMLRQTLALLPSAWGPPPRAGRETVGSLRTQAGKPSPRDVII